MEEAFEALLESFEQSPVILQSLPNQEIVAGHPADTEAPTRSQKHSHQHILVNLRLLILEMSPDCFYDQLASSGIDGLDWQNGHSHAWC